MRCPKCQSTENRVIDSRPTEDGAVLRRRRLCEDCGVRFSTHERVIQNPLVIVKKDGRREEFDAEKLRSGVSKACNKRPVSTDSINELVADIERCLRQENRAEVEAQAIGEMVMERLFTLDQVAYVRFASVYQRFDDVRRFAQLLERMSRRQKRRREQVDESVGFERADFESELIVKQEAAD